MTSKKISHFIKSFLLELKAVKKTSKYIRFTKLLRLKSLFERTCVIFNINELKLFNHTKILRASKNFSV